VQVSEMRSGRTTVLHDPCASSPFGRLTLRFTGLSATLSARHFRAIVVKSHLTDREDGAVLGAQGRYTDALRDLQEPLLRRVIGVIKPRGDD
jgi:hypothetical protein